MSVMIPPAGGRVSIVDAGMVMPSFVRPPLMTLALAVVVVAVVVIVGAFVLRRFRVRVRLSVVLWATIIAFSAAFVLAFVGLAPTELDAP